MLQKHFYFQEKGEINLLGIASTDSQRIAATSCSGVQLPWLVHKYLSPFQGRDSVSHPHVLNRKYFLIFQSDQESDHENSPLPPAET